MGTTLLHKSRIRDFASPHYPIYNPTPNTTHPFSIYAQLVPHCSMCPLLNHQLSSPGGQDGNNEENLTARQRSLRAQGHNPTRPNSTRSRTVPAQEGRLM